METSETKAIIAEYVKRARVAQKAIDSYSQKQVDALVRAVAKAICDNAEYLARLAVDETRMGVYEDKVTEMNMVYDPSHPDADENGYVLYPNVNIITEMTNLIDASRSYEANSTAFTATKAMAMKGLSLGQ